MNRTQNLKSIEPRILIFQFVGYTKNKYKLINKLNKRGLFYYVVILIRMGPKGWGSPWSLRLTHFPILSSSGGFRNTSLLPTNYQ